MTPAPQRTTLAAPASIDGVGLFTGRQVRCIIRPAHGPGLVFRRLDLDEQPEIPAHIRALSSQPVHPAFARIPPRHTCLQAQGAAVITTEHLMAALAGLGVTDAEIELDAPELPIGDGSALHFIDAILSAGLRPMGDEAAPIEPREPLSVESADGRASITAEPLDPGEPPVWRYLLDYGPDAPIPPHEASWNGGPETFRDRIAPARTFSLREEAEQMQSLGLFKGFAPRDLLVIDRDGRPIDNAWRHPEEPARHKLLDLIGDLALAGAPIHARITSRGGGHALNHDMARALARAGSP